MGIGSRSYARPYAMGGGLPQGIRLLLIANVAVFLLQTFGLGGPLLNYFALRPAALADSLAIWQLASYMFLHGGVFHILFNTVGREDLRNDESLVDLLGNLMWQYEKTKTY